MSAVEQLLPTFEPTPIELVRSMTLQQRVDRAIALLREHEPAEGYYLAFSGGKDSIAIEHLAKIAGVRFDKTYHPTTIDPPELIRFIKCKHAAAKWEFSPHGNLIHQIQVNGMPTRFARWCCRLFKEAGGIGRVCVFGVRAAESHARKIRWNEVSESNGRPVICPIVYWTDAQVWELILAESIPYCGLYDEGFERLGCVGCPLINATPRQRQFDRWPRYAHNWQNACHKYWDTHKDQYLPAKRKMNFCSQFKTWRAYWEWWMADKTPDIMREECQTGVLWTNQELDEEP